MPITLSAKYLAELKKNVNTPDIIIEVVLDGGTRKFGLHTQFSDVNPCLDSATSLQNKINPEDGYASLGNMQFVLIGRDNFKDLIQDEFLKNRRVTKHEGFIADGFEFSDYADTYTGIISNWSRKGGKLTITVADDLKPALKKFPVEIESKIQFHDYSNTNPVDIMTNLILTQAGIPAARVNSSQFESERDLWLVTWKFQRILTKPKEIKKLLNELQVETNSFVFHDGEKVSFKVFAPLLPGETAIEFSDANDILLDSVSQQSGYSDQFFNRIVFYYDYNESGEDGEQYFDSAHIVVDADSQDSSQWDEATTKTIFSKWIKSHTFTQPSNVAGATIYHVSKANGLNAGKTGSTLTFNKANETFTWEAPDGTTGATVKVTKDGRYDVYDADRTKYIRVLVDYSELPGSNQSDTIDITALLADNYAAAIANKNLNRYRDPASIVNFAVDVNKSSNGGDLWKPTDSLLLTTDDACIKGKNTLNQEPMMFLSVKANARRGSLEFSTIQTNLFSRYGFIGAASITMDYKDASDAQREYAFIGRSSDNKVFDGSGFVEGFLIW